MGGGSHKKAGSKFSSMDQNSNRANDDLINFLE